MSALDPGTWELLAADSSVRVTHARAVVDAEAGTPSANEVRAALGASLERQGLEDLGELRLGGRLIRPRLALAVRDRVSGEIDDTAFWSGALAIQLAHEASLVHDDIIDGAERRRGAPSHHASHGEREALLWGDRLLTSAYRAAAGTSCERWIRRFASAVDRTVEGERSQRRKRGVTIRRAEYERLVRSKTGELLGAALALAPDLSACTNGVAEPFGPGQPGPTRPVPCGDDLHELGVELGLIYQMADDLLDYCPHVDRGKAPFADHADGRWTWVLDRIPRGLGASVDDVVRALGHPDSTGTSPMDGLVDEWRRRVDRWRVEAADIIGELPLIEPLLDEWSSQMRQATRGTSLPSSQQPPQLSGTDFQAVARRSEPSPALVARIPEDWERHIARHSRSFRLASRLAPADARRRIAAVYAFCRVTDDLVDGAVAPTDARWTPADTIAHGTAGPRADQTERDRVARMRAPLSRETASALLDEWMQLARSAYDGERVGVPLLDTAMSAAARSGVPFEYVSELVEGMRMDLRATPYPDMEALRRYTYRVASVVGQWLTRLFGVDDPWVLERAATLGHAMQLTNILRDVGEDMSRGRVYLPEDALRANGVDLDFVAQRARGGHPLPREWVSVMEQLMSEAHAAYESAWQAIPALPPFLARSVAVAAEVYSGIHDAIRANDYDVFTRRAHTSGLSKTILAGRALGRLRRETARWHRHPGATEREQVVLLDASGAVIGQAEKLMAHRSGMLHSAFSVFVFDDRGRLLIQRRALAKYHSGGLWSNTACGHPRPGEGVRAAAQRRLLEEMGVHCALEPVLRFRYRRPVGDGLVEHELDHVLIGYWRGTPDPDSEEVDGWAWVEPDAALRDARRQPQLYTAWFGSALARLLRARPLLRSSRNGPKDAHRRVGAPVHAGTWVP